MKLIKKMTVFFTVMVCANNFTAGFTNNIPAYAANIPGSICLATQDNAALGSKINVGSLITSIKTHGKSFLSGKTFLYSTIAACAIGFLGFMGYKSWQKKKEATKDLLAAMSSLYQNEQEDVLLYRIKNAIDNGANVNANDYGCTPLHFACIKGHTKIVELLLAKGAKINAVNVDGYTSLHYACRNSHTEIVELLLAKGADIKAVNENGETPLRLACIKGHTKIVKLLLAKGDDVNTVVKNAAYINTSPYYKIFSIHTPLHFACLDGNIDMVKLLLKYGAEVNAFNLFGSTALYDACKKNNLDLAMVLLENGAEDIDLGVEKPSKMATDPRIIQLFTLRNEYLEEAQKGIFNGDNFIEKQDKELVPFLKNMKKLFIKLKKITVPTILNEKALMNYADCTVYLV